MAWLIYKAVNSAMSKGANSSKPESIFEFTVKGNINYWKVYELTSYSIHYKDEQVFCIFSYTSLYSDIDGNEVSLEKYRGHVCIIVNVASKWGKTDVNYKQLVEMYKTHSEGKKIFKLVTGLKGLLRSSWNCEYKLMK